MIRGLIGYLFTSISAQIVAKVLARKFAAISKSFVYIITLINLESQKLKSDIKLALGLIGFEYGLLEPQQTAQIAQRTEFKKPTRTILF